MPVVFEPISAAGPSILGEGAFWDDGHNCVWWVDIRGSKLFQYRVDDSELRTWTVPEWITRVIPTQVEGQLIGTLASSFCRINVLGPELQIDSVYTLENDDIRFNDGAVDPQGEYWAGTMPLSEDQPIGRWMRFGLDGQVQVLDTHGFTVTNGPAFDHVRQIVYLTDSAARCIYRADFAPDTGISELILWRRFHSDEGYPDGMVIGPDGLLWVAFWDGGCLRALDSKGKIVRSLELPVSRPTSIAFRTETQLYVTSAAFGLADDGMQGMTIRVLLDD